MRDIVVRLVASYEDLVSSLEEIMTLQGAMTEDGTIASISQEREALKAELQEKLARNCSLRRKDFERMMEGILSEAERKKGALQQEQKSLTELIQEYAGQQREIAATLRAKLAEYAPVDGRRDGFHTLLANLRTTQEERGQEVLDRLRDFRLRAETFRREQEIINRRLRRAIDRGSLLAIEDIRRLKNVTAGQRREAEREARRSDVARLLSEFRRQRRG